MDIGMNRNDRNHPRQTHGARTTRARAHAMVFMRLALRGSVKIVVKLMSD
jgi:hypothetical protein